MARRLAAAVVATLGLLSMLAVPVPASAQADDEATTTSATEGADDSAAEGTSDSAAEPDAEATEDAAVETEAEAEAEAEVDSATETEAEAQDEVPAEAEPTSTATIAKRGDRGGAVRNLQTRLVAAGFAPGVADGIFGRRTEGALVSFQRTVGLGATGVYDTETADRLESYTPTPPADDTDTDPGSSTIMSTREAQQRLSDNGFDPGPVDGLYGRRTRAGLEAFQRHAGLAVTGVVDAATSEALRTYDSGGSTDQPPDDGDDDDTADPLLAAQQALADGPFDPGPIDGAYGTKTKNAIWSLEKLAGITRNGQWGADDEAALQRVLAGTVGGPSAGYSRRWVEVDLSQQLMKVYDPGRTVPVLVSHVSSGSGIPWRQGRYSGRSITPVGSFTIFRRISGWRQSSLGIGSLYNPLYFTSSGIALHGSRSVPSYPASHGCVRVPMHIAEYLPGLLPNGTPVVVMD